MVFMGCIVLCVFEKQSQTFSDKKLINLTMKTDFANMVDILHTVNKLQSQV